MPNRRRARTIAMTEDRSHQIKLAAEMMGVSGERLIQDAISNYLACIFGRIYMGVK